MFLRGWDRLFCEFLMHSLRFRNVPKTTLFPYNNKSRTSCLSNRRHSAFLWHWRRMWKHNNPELKQVPIPATGASRQSIHACPSLSKRSFPWARLLFILLSRTFGKVSSLLPQTQQVKLCGKQRAGIQKALWGLAKPEGVKSWNICDWLGNTLIAWCTIAPLILILVPEVGSKIGGRKYVKALVNMIVAMFCFFNLFYF